LKDRARVDAEEERYQNDRDTTNAASSDGF
jgi:hypothetical protein